MAKNEPVRVRHPGNLSTLFNTKMKGVCCCFRILIDSMVTIFNSIKKYGPELALDKVIRSNIMPSLEGLERNEIRCMFLKAKEVLGANSMVTETLDRMANSDSLSLF